MLFDAESRDRREYNHSGKTHIFFQISKAIYFFHKLRFRQESSQTLQIEISTRDKDLLKCCNMNINNQVNASTSILVIRPLVFHSLILTSIGSFSCFICTKHSNQMISISLARGKIILSCSCRN